MKKSVICCLIILVSLLSNYSVFADEDNEPSSWAEQYVKDSKERGKLIEDGRLFSDYHEAITRQDFAYLGVMIYEEITNQTTTVYRSES